MGLHEITLRNFRLFHDVTFTPDPESITVFLSPNGTGKTSVLEAVHTLATASSFRTTTASDMILMGTSVAEVHGVITQQARRVAIDLTLTRGVRKTTKRMLVNGQRPTSRAEVAEVIPLTVFTPEGVDVVRNGAEHRRNFLNLLMTDVWVQTADLLENFNRALSQRNAVLRSWNGSPPSFAQLNELEPWDQEFCRWSAQLVRARERLIEALSPRVGDTYADIAHQQIPVAMSYERSWGDDLAGELRAALRHDVARGYTTQGPHRDDLRLELAQRDARRQSSQGEQRSLALALRLAGHHLVHSVRGVEPLLLLDDVFSELDPTRSERLLHILPRGQALVTTATPLPHQMKPASIIDVAAAS